MTGDFDGYEDHDALGLAALIAAGEVSADAVLTAALSRVEARNPALNAVIRRMDDEARQTVEASLSGYRAGEVDFLTLVDNWRKLLDFQLMYQASLTELERSFAGLQEAVGHDLERDGTPKRGDAADAEIASGTTAEDGR